MFLSKRSNGIYYLWYVDEVGYKHKVSTRCNRRTDALQFIREFKEGERTRQAKLKRATLSQFLYDFTEYSRGIHTPNTTETYRTALREFRNVVGDLPLHSIGIREIETFLRRKKSEASEWSARKYYISLSSAFETAKRWECIRNNPFRKVEKPRTRELHPSYLSKDDFRQLMKVVLNEDLKALYMCAVSTGLRLGELTALQWTDIDPVSRVIHIRNSDTFTTKSRRNRVVPMSDQLCTILARRKEGVSSELVFHLRGRQLTRWHVAKVFKKHAKLAGLSTKVHFHSLRHTFASWLVQDGVSLYAVQKLLGHSSISVTQVYSHLQPEQLHETVNRLRVP